LTKRKYKPFRLSSLDRRGTRKRRLEYRRMIGYHENGKYIWEADCDCGNVTQTTGNKQSCGCLLNEYRKAHFKQYFKPAICKECKKPFTINTSRKNTRGLCLLCGKRYSNKLSARRRRERDKIRKGGA
jgi:hypothetical protein